MSVERKIATDAVMDIAESLRQLAWVVLPLAAIGISASLMFWLAFWIIFGGSK